MSLPEVQLIAGTGTEAVKLAPVALAMRAAGLLMPMLVAAGDHLPTITRALAAFELVTGATVPAQALAELTRQLDALWAVRRPAAVMVQGDSPVSLAGALAAAWRRIPVVHLSAGLRGDEFTAPSEHEPNGRLIAQVATLHLVPVAIAGMNLIDEGVPARSVLITGDTGYEAALAIAGRRLPTSRVASVNPNSDGRTAIRATQAVAAMLGLADRPTPLPVPSFRGAPNAVSRG
jgi:UDP-N-acetylglucosamine 2-epimerase (non-hydrolysing)